VSGTSSNTRLVYNLEDRASVVRYSVDLREGVSVTCVVAAVPRRRLSCFKLAGRRFTVGLIEGIALKVR
jgi:hypothetical protein